MKEEEKRGGRGPRSNASEGGSREKATPSQETRSQEKTCGTTQEKKKSPTPIEDAFGVDRRAKEIYSFAVSVRERARLGIGKKNRTGLTI